MPQLPHKPLPLVHHPGLNTDSSRKFSTMEETIEKFKSFGLTDKRVGEIKNNKKVLGNFTSIVDYCTSKGVDSLDDKKIAMLHSLSLKSTNPMIIDGVLDGRLKTTLQLDEAVKYVNSTDSPDVKEMEKVSGVGIEVSDEEVKTIISDYLTTRKEEIESKRYALLPKVMGDVRKLEALKWANAGLFKPVIDQWFLDTIGPKDERDVVKKEKKPKAKAATKDTTKPTEERTMFTEGFLKELHKPGENPQKYPELMAHHLDVTKGQVWTRFPPEPNGYLHIGHSKAIMVNFGYASYHNGKCYLRFDDTNPEAEEEIYFTKIKETIEWLGFKPWKITYSSDYFDELYELAEQLIKCGRAYVDHSTPEEVKAQRGMKEDGTLGGERFASKWRSRSVEENLTEFRKMKNGEYEVGKAFLRMKQDLESPNPQMWDLVAYRVLNTPHHRTGDKWKIYPTYDFTHCLVDSFENISHSLCTTEFRLSRESYEWLCDELKVFRPAQREYGRLNLTGTVLSKRKILKLVTEKYVRDWDDPRLYTLEAIKRRGIPPGAILNFINTLGVTTSTTNIQIVRFESSIRSYLDLTTPRLMMLLNPIEIEVDNVEEDFALEVEIPYQRGPITSRKLTFKKHIYIDADDYRDEFNEDYFRLAPGQPVGLVKVPFNISVKEVVRDSNGHVTKLIVNYDNDKKVKPKTFIHWLPKGEVKSIKEVRIYNQLFNSENPSAHPTGFLDDINPESEIVLKNALIENNFDDIKAKSPLNIKTGGKFDIDEAGGKETVRFQAMRTGYFCLDKDSEDELIFNRIVTLKEDSNK
ncbi:glutamine--tRNA ligase [[Candida] jaroonii]|uniref:Glutamine--tRNA ligase n=1 Tax=[Candida] jaroonii TaxID=467808 RepID=A0ACA9Y4Z2_9ASCO|nr:glutamine--tRNA ligase [[Candida] jaroonii]